MVKLQNSKAEDPPGQGEHGAVYHRTERPGLRQAEEVRADATLGGTLTTGSHTGVFLRKAEAEISGWRQWFF